MTATDNAGIPHLTVTETAPAEQVRAARRSIAPALPIRANIDTLTPIDFDGACWRPTRGSR